MAQTPKELARVIASTDRGIAEWLWTQKTGSPPRRLDDYDPQTLRALLAHSDAIAKQIQHIAAQSADPNAPVITGDPLIDKWERELAEGKTPDLNEEQP